VPTVKSAQRQKNSTNTLKKQNTKQTKEKTIWQKNNMKVLEQKPETLNKHT